ncbi:WD40 repeat-like protein [Thelephora terrestris]|uniref:WD40 repeat-like protein n=1 Tax=Thelephora terrestris TaxID=56493 RepID=A0A9P6L2N7_9AGAM|nr:WD40 repeat-like protein [Thelephora terrestris]
MIKERALGNLLDAGFPYSRCLLGHSSCVNTLAFSNGDGRFLASGGDDLKIQLYDFQQEDLNRPSWSFVGPMSNVFSLAFSANNTHLYCGTTGHKLYKYDLATLRDVSQFPISPIDMLDDHDDTIRDVTCHPSQSELAMTASEDGRIVLRDSRIDARRPSAQATLQNDSEVTGVRWNPRMESLFATSDNRGRVCLRDVRTAFGSGANRTRKPLQQFVTSLSKPTRNSLVSPESSSIAWDREDYRSHCLYPTFSLKTHNLGLTSTTQNFYPTLYALSDPHPIAICRGGVLPDGSPIPDGERTYSNACTIKHGSFGGPSLTSDAYYGAGSDDFRGYVWKIPETAMLLERRREIDVDSWLLEEAETAAFARSARETRYQPVSLSQPLFRLNGHMSIVNSVLFHPSLLHIVTAGIERHVILHSPTKSSPCTEELTLTPTTVRSLPAGSAEDHSRLIQAIASGLGTNDMEEDAETIALFDEIIRTEGEGRDVFSSRECDESEDEDEGASESDEDTRWY